VEAAVEVRVPVRLVAGVDDGAGAGGGGGDRLPHVVAASGEDELRARPLARFAGGGGGDAAGAGDDLAGDQEGQQVPGQAGELAAPVHEVVLVGAEGVAGGVDVVLEQVDAGVLAGLGQALIGLGGELGEDPLPRPVLGHQVPPV